jgi:hypothetical protein
VVLLHITVLQREAHDGLEWALVPALQLAAGGKSLKERRIGEWDKGGLGEMQARVVGRTKQGWWNGKARR